MRYPRYGFTLIELIIVVAIIAILAAIAIPGLIRGRMATNETSAISSLKTLLTAQEQFRQARAVDIDSDGQGEYGYIQELTGVSACRISGAVSGPTLAPPVLGQQFGSSALSASGVAEKSGYFFLIYLPSATTAIAESVPLPPRQQGRHQEARRVGQGRPGLGRRQGLPALRDLCLVGRERRGGVPVPVRAGGRQCDGLKAQSLPCSSTAMRARTRSRNSRSPFKEPGPRRASRPHPPAEEA